MMRSFFFISHFISFTCSNRREQVYCILCLLSLSLTILQPMTRSSTKEAQRQENAPVEFQSVLRLRPLLKKEREEHVALEPTNGTTVVVHPLPPKEILSPSSTLVMQNNVQMEHDVEFSFDTVFAQDSDQDKVYFSLGHPIAQTAMGPLKTNDPDSLPSQTNLVISMGLVDAGKSYSCWGEGTVSKRKAKGDGLVPRIIDSLFSQSKHHVSRQKGHRFAVNCTFLQIDQSKGNSAEEPKILDLLQPVVRHFIPNIPLAAVAGALTSPSASCTSSKAFSRSESNGTSTSSSGYGSYSSLDEPVLVEQDPVSSDCLLVNGQTRMCTSAESARLCLHTAMENRKKLKNKKVDSHVLVQMQPVVVDKSGETVAEGGRIAVLDMASIDHYFSASSKTKSRTVRMKDTIPNRSDAHSAVLHCLRALQNNQTAIALDEASSEGSLSPRSEDSVYRRKSIKKVPFLQHKLTMLLQPLFSAHYTDYTLVTLFVTAYIGHRDNSEKKELFQELQTLYRPCPTRGANTGLQCRFSPSKLRKFKGGRQEKPLNSASDADDEESNRTEKRNRRIPTKESLKKSSVVPKCIPKAMMIERASSMSYSESSADDEQIIPLPPPIAPGYKPPPQQYQNYSSRNVWLPGATAPYEDSIIPPFSASPTPAAEFAGMPSTFLPGRETNFVPKELSTDCRDDVDGKSSSLSCFDDINIGDSNTATDAVAAENASPLKDYSKANKVHAESVPEQKFSSYIKTFNKVVNASKKKSRKVLEKMTVTTCTSGHGFPSADSERKNEERTKELEEKNVQLLRQIAEMWEENDKLRKENVALKQDRTDIALSYDYSDEDSICVSPPPKEDKVFSDAEFQHKASLTDLSSGDEGDVDHGDSASDVPSPSPKHESIFDNPLFEQMVKMSTM